jgi:ribonuclease P protein component
MDEGADNTLSKDERLHKQTLIDDLFGTKSRQSFVAYPLRLVYLYTDGFDGAQAQMLISVSKKHFKRAVKRNRIKRQVREAYRKNKDVILDVLANHQNQGLAMGFLWLSDNLYTSKEVEKKVVSLLHKVKTKI